uniref:Histidine--tRNA ligase, chloroplastic n=1 Tax=Melanthalia intermedia TaxID=172989 RepID=A0A345UB05_9FLOR|nr:histidine-tRNA ligase [Melanthalia intermedia]AXI97641.1 histidine-tRNA ligase [Melanthalia intermedia]
MQALRGTKDILPQESIYWQYIYNKALKILSLYNYLEIRTPVIESVDLFKRSIGEATDILSKEMYTFTDQSNRNIALRPEGTASIARAFINHQLYQKNTQRLWYLGPMFRYERPQSGRQRQFHQLGIECIGSLNPMADAEVINLANRFLQEIQFRSYKIEINSIGSLENRKKYQQDLIKYLIPYEKDLDKDSQKRLNINPLRILDSKNKRTQEILNDAPSLSKYLDTESRQHLWLVCTYLDDLKIKYNVNDRLVRGLDYYNSTAFEFKSNLVGSQNAICGGGRYDQLIRQLGGPDTPAVGWAIGLERLLHIARDELKIKKKGILIYIATQGIKAQKKIWEIIQVLEKQEIRFELDLHNNNFQKQLKRASKSGAKACIILGNDEIENNFISIKRLDQHKQYAINKTNLLEELKKIEKTVEEKDQKTGTID